MADRLSLDLLTAPSDCSAAYFESVSPIAPSAILIYVHKEFELDDVEERYPADHYVLIDDKLRILTAVKEVWGDRVTTVFPRQGHYALDEKIAGSYPAPDYTISRIGELATCNFQALVEGGTMQAGAAD